jgi:hypothetical protein
MSILNIHVCAMLRPEELSDCFGRLDWNMQEDPRYAGKGVRGYVLRSASNDGLG